MDGGGTAGVVLVGGRSSRMGTPKAALEWYGSTLLARAVGVLARAVDGPVVVVAAPGQELPAARAEVVRDPVEGRGPLQGIAAGLRAVADRSAAAFVCSVDLPFLHPAFVRAVLAAVGPGVDVALPVARGYNQPLAAAYRTTLAPRIDALIAAGRMRPAMLFEQVAVRRLDEAALRADPGIAAADPALDSVLNVNSPDDYRAARDRAAPKVTVRRFGALASGGRSGPVTVEAATLGAAAAAAGLVLDRHIVAALNGDQITRDAQVPLVAGDEISLLSADAGG